MKLNTRMFIALLLISSIIAVTISYMVIIKSTEFNNLTVADFKKDMMKRYDSEIKTATDVLASNIQQIYRLESIDRDTKMLMVSELIRKARYKNDKSGYFWADTFDGTCIAHGDKKELENKNRWMSKDLNGKFLIQEIINNGRKIGGGFTNYTFTKIGSTEQYPKRGYSIAINEFKIVIGTGNYIDDIDLEVKAYSDVLDQNSLNLIYIIISIILIGLMLLSSLVYITNINLVHRIVSFSNRLMDLSKFDANMTLHMEESGPLELLNAAKNFNKFIISMHDTIASLKRDLSDVTSLNMRSEEFIRKLEIEISNLSSRSTCPDAKTKLNGFLLIIGNLKSILSNRNNISSNTLAELKRFKTDESRLDIRLCEKQIEEISKDIQRQLNKKDR